ncbi:unnamed protein product [Rotaria sordida]|uniref:SecA family profile domain-containing protein n=1 Tax=Rotaria sordida TaxID=392033 RepID=A0A819M8D4_9BILA|nr:unnamed protein product [Rotaria sordida]
MILCDAPGFGDTAGSEVDIANSIGVIEALKGTKSVKLLALSSYKSLGDRGEGIQELARVLVAMIHGIEDKLDSIVYGFTKYPEDIDPNAELVNIKTSKVNEDVALQYDTAFVTVLNDMIDKTEEGAFKIEPTGNIPKKNGDHALEYIKTLVSDMDTLRTIPELETRTAGIYYRTIENIRGYMQQLQGEAEKLLIAIDQQSDITNYRNLARSISRLKNSEWINQASPGTYDNLMRRITEDLVQYVCQLEDSFMKIDFSLKCPENVSIAEEIVKKIESMRDLEQSVPELKPYTEKILQRFLRCTQEAFDRIQKTFNLQDKNIYKIKQKLKELEEIKREYDDLHPTRIYLHKNGYSNIDMLSNDIEELKAKKKLEIEVLTAAQRDIEAELQHLNSVKHHHEKLQRIEDQNTELTITLERLESIKKEHDSLINTRHSSSEQASFLQGKGFDSYEVLDKSIQEIERIFNERGKNQQSYHFSDRLDVSTANNALIYISQCGKVSHDRVKENAIDANENLRRYIREYGIFLKQEINTKFNYLRTVGDERDPFLHSQDLEMCLQELSSFNKFPEVFTCINAAETIEDLQQKFFEYHRILNAKMEEYKVAAKIKELKDQVIIAQALTCVDRFCVNIFAGNGFSALYRQYQGEIHKECRIAYKTVLDHISKGDYAKADMALTDIQDKPLNERDKAQIQNDLFCSLNKLMKDTISVTNWLDGKIEREDNRDQIMKIKENIEKIRIACNKHMLMELLDKKIQTDLKNFDNEINKILSRIILKGLNSIEAFMDADSFSEAEQGMETLSKVQRELADYCVSTDVTKKSDELRKRLDLIVTKILERNDFEDVNKYSINPPKDLLAKLKIVASHGSARYVQAHNSMEGKIRQTFNLAIDQVHKAPLNERSVRIRSLKYALCFLPDDLQAQFKSQIDELSNLIADEVTAYRQDLEASFTHVNENEHTITRDADDFRMYYNHLLSFERNIRISGIDIRQILDESQDKIMAKDNTEPDLEVLVTQTKLLVSTVKQTDTLSWNRSFTDNIPELVAHISAIWTLKNTQHYNTMRGIDEADTYLLMPHVGQIIAIFRLLGLGYEKTEKIPILKVLYKKLMSGDLVNNLVEVGTGEGKSVVLAIAACVFALTGVDVNCSCYSEVLSTRDKKDFASVFRTLGIEDRIEYGTFNKLCEQLLNEQCNVREKVRNMIITNQSALPVVNTLTRTRSKVLLIDEVDVFLSDKYYGGMYIPSVYLKHPSIKALLDSIWQNKTLRLLNSVKALPAYKTCATQYSNWIFLFDEAIKDMIAALQSYQSSTYLVQNDRIVYVEGESVVDNVVRGYDTVWAYYHENGKGNISQASLEENAGILINCGTFSYAEMPHDFSYIGGVTGTLKTLAEVEKNILEEIYEIKKRTFMPSVFGSSNRIYNPMTDVRVVNEKEYFMYIRDEIRAICNAKRAILVFFESEEKLMTFYNSEELSPIKENVQIIMEKVSVKERELYVKRAATISKVTLLTRTFGRGTDFICRNQQLLANGGIHVLQTFFSEELSEEYQIMGRSARQGDFGSYRMVLLDKDLEWVLGSSWMEELPRIVGTTLYENLNKARSIRYESKCGAKELGIKQCKAEHKASKEFMRALTSGDILAVKDFLKKKNQGANLITASSRTVLLMDATGSMSSLLSAAKETVCTMYERATFVLNKQGLPSDAFQMQFVVYRDYDCKNDGILQSSSWELKPNNLRNFMTQIVAMGGGDYEEAIEIGLWYAVQQSEQPDRISQVILIGDAPAKDKPAIKRDRQAHGGEAYWSKTKYQKPTHYTDELEKLKAKGIPVHAFYLHRGAKENFERIASVTSGRCEHLNINSPQGAELLTNFVTEEVLRKTAGSQGDAAVGIYRATPWKSFTS